MINEADSVRRIKDDGYLVPAPLVHKAIWSIIGSLIAIAGYMAIWAVNDAAFKARIEERINHIVKRMERLEDNADHDAGKNGP